jgi:hypothetical protein
MNSVQLFRSRGFAWFVQAGLWCLLYLAVLKLGGKAPDYNMANGVSAPTQTLAPVARLGPLFAATSVMPAAALNPTNTPFYTTHFVPPSPAPPTTRKIEVTYQGFYQTAEGPKCAVLKVGDAFVVTRLGALVATNVYVADATLQSLTLTNRSAPPILLPLNVKKEIEVPIN